MSAVRAGVPPLIEQQLLALDKQIRDATFVRGAARTVLGVCLFLGTGFVFDSIFGLNAKVRIGLLAGWLTVGIALLWRGVVRPAFAPVSLSALAAVIEKQFPELRERLSSLVELRGSEESDLAPGASKLMQDLLARQTVKAVDQLSLEGVASDHGPLKAVMAGAVSVLLLVAPFAWNSDGYGLLWTRFFNPWGNSAWGVSIDLKVLEGNQVIARGSDVPIHVTATERRRQRVIEKSSTDPLWLTWRDATQASDRRRLEWDEESGSFMTTLPHVQQSLSFDVATNGARSGTYQIEVADPPVITQFKLDIEPAPYTGLPARILAGVPSEITLPEFSRVQVQVEFQEPVVEAELVWPIEAVDPTRTNSRRETRQVGEQKVTVELSPDRRHGTAHVVALVSGPFVLRAKNSSGLRNNDPFRRLIVEPDQPPQLKLDGPDEPILVRPDDLVELPVEVHDDYGLTAVELHLETSTGINQVERLSDEQRRDPDLAHQFNIELTQFALTGGQVVTYRIRAVDNRPQPFPQEVWSATRTLMINTSLKQIPDQELAKETKQLEQELADLRTELNESKAELVKLHEQIEKESLNRQPESDKNDRLTELQQELDKLIEQLQQLADHFDERQMTQEMAPIAERIAEDELQAVNERLQQSKSQAPRDQLEPVAQAIDRMGAADRKLQQLERQLNELNKLEQDLAELNRVAQRAERVAEQLEKLDATVNKSNPDPNPPNTEESTPEQTNAARPNRDQSPDQPKNPDAESVAATNPPNGNEAAEEALQKLKDEGARLTEQMNELLKKHPELVDAARREQQDQLKRLAEQARQLAVPQQQLADALKREAENAPAVASRPENAVPQPGDERQEPARDLPAKLDEQPDSPAARPGQDPSQAPQPAGQQQSDSQKSDTAEKKAADGTDSGQPKSENGDRQANPSQNTPTDSKPNKNPQKDGREAAEKQDQIAQKATQQALELARDIGADAAATKAAIEFARKANAAKDQAQSGQLNAAAKEARAAEKAANETNRQLNPEGQSTSPQSQAAQQLADQQRQAAQKLEELAKSPEASKGAQLQGQRQLADATKKIAEQLEQAAKTLKSEPLNAGQPAESGERAKKGVDEAQAAMKQSEQANKQNDPARSSQAASDAAEKLKQAASEVKPAPSQPSNSAPVPKKVGAQVAEAAKQMKSAQQQLQQCNGNCQNPASAKSGSKSGSSSGSSGNPSQSDSPSESQSQNSAENKKPTSGEGSQQEAKGAPAQGGKPQASAQSEGNQPGKPGQGNKSHRQDGQPTSADGQTPTNESSKKGDPREGQNSQSAPQSGNRNGSKSEGDSKEGQRQGPNSSSPQDSSPQDSQLAQAAEQFRDVAAMLRQIRGEPKENSGGRKPRDSQRPASRIPGEDHADSKPGEGGNAATGNTSSADLSELESELQKQTRHNWGRLPGQLRTEILQGAGKKSHPEYTQRIKSYFDEITKPAK